MVRELDEVGSLADPAEEYADSGRSLEVVNTYQWAIAEDLSSAVL